MNIVFLAGAFRGDGSEEAKSERVEIARQWVRRFIENEIPYYSPHLNISEETIAFGKEKDVYANYINTEILGKCEILAVLPNWEESSGTRGEIEEAKNRNIPVVYLEEDGAIEKLNELLI